MTKAKVKTKTKQNTPTDKSRKPKIGPPLVTPKIVIKKTKQLFYKDISKMMLLSDPWKKMGFTPKDVRAVVKSSKEAIPICAFVKNQKSKEKFAGFALLIPDILGGYYLKLLAVDSDLRGLGIGEKLMTYCESFIFARSKNFYLFVSSFNEAGIKFYTRLGFERVGIFKDLVIKGHDEYFYRKTTGPWRKSAKQRK